ncbi:hypothetical protein ACTFIZ_005586 [Dictyostelium cf. discoideum]
MNKINNNNKNNIHKLIKSLKIGNNDRINNNSNSNNNNIINNNNDLLIEDDYFNGLLSTSPLPSQFNQLSSSPPPINNSLESIPMSPIRIQNNNVCPGAPIKPKKYLVPKSNYNLPRQRLVFTECVGSDSGISSSSSSSSTSSLNNSSNYNSDDESNATVVSFSPKVSKKLSQPSVQFIPTSSFRQMDSPSGNQNVPVFNSPKARKRLVF